MKENLNTGGKYSTAIFGKFSNAIDSIQDDKEGIGHIFQADAILLEFQDLCT